MIQGGCFCKKIRYEIDAGDHLVVNCHCSMCRKTSAAPFVSWLVIAKDAFRYISGNPKVLHSSDKGTREFCSDCGTPLTFTSTERPDNIDITTGSLDKPNDFVPTIAVHEDSKLSWLQATE